MTKLFISYRREDSMYQADRLHKELKFYVPEPARDIFIDVESIPVGVDFVEHLDAKVAACDVMLVLIGPRWLDARNAQTGRRRLEEADDFVRIEIASALRRGVVVAPVLLDDALLPNEADLPDDLKALPRRQKVDVRLMTFDTDVARLAKGLGLRDLRQPQVHMNPTPTGNSLFPENSRKLANGDDADDPFKGWNLRKFTTIFREFQIDPGVILGPKLANASDEEKVARLRTAATSYDKEVVELEGMTLKRLKEIAAELGVVVDVGRVRLPDKQADIYASQIAATKILRAYARQNEL